MSGCSNINVFENIELPVIKNATVLADETNIVVKNLILLTNEKYPSEQIAYDYDKYFNESGWVKCKSKISNNWDSFLDLSSNKSFRKFQKVYYYANFDDKIIGTIYLFYISDAIQDEKFPDNDEQYIHIVLRYSFDVHDEFNSFCR